MSYAIKGIPMPAHPDPQHPIPLRKEFTAWASDPENAVQLSLFIQALIKFQQMDPSNKLSYYQIAGIHGQPATSWDGAATPTSGPWCTSMNRMINILVDCNHNKTTFPTWHRPYMALYEQRLYEVMMHQIIPNITPASEQSIWTIEASHWRLPYWDWAQEQPYLQNVGVPLLFTQPTVTVLMPNSKSATLNNPLWAFKNPSGKPMGDNSMSPWSISMQPKFNNAIATSRHGVLNKQTSAAWANGINNFKRANSSIQAHSWDFSQPGDPNYAISDLVSRLMSANYLKSWRHFSSTLHSGEGGAPSPTEFLSLEMIHNDIHDRQLAMWQTLNPQKWFDNLAPGDTGSKAALSPFHKDTNSTLFTSDDIRDWTKLNYQYDTLENTPRWIRATAGGNVTSDHIADHVRRTVNMHLNKSRQAVLASPQLQGKENDYIINVMYDRYGLQGKSYSIHFFIGHAPELLPADVMYQDLPGYVGTIYTFSSSLEVAGEGRCASCVEQRDAGLLSRAQVVLTLKLIDQANNPDIKEINSLRPDQIEAYLAKHLTWKIVEAISGRVVPAEELPKTKVYVLAGKAQHFEDPQQLSQYGDYDHVWGATQGKAGGAAPADQGTHMEL